MRTRSPWPLAPLLALAAACGSRADYELVHLRELLRHGDHAALRAQHELLPASVRERPEVRELLLAAELEGAGLSSVDLVLELPVLLGRLPAGARVLPTDLFEPGQRERVVSLAESGLAHPAPPGSLARRLDVATLLVAGLTEHRAGHPAGLDRCLVALDAMATDPGPAGAAAAGILAELAELPPRATVVEAGLAGADPRRAALARYLEAAP